MWFFVSILSGKHSCQACVDSRAHLHITHVVLAFTQRLQELLRICPLLEKYCFLLLFPFDRSKNATNYILNYSNIEAIVNCLNKAVPCLKISPFEPRSLVTDDPPYVQS